MRAVRREVRVVGTVQGVGFRPFVFRLAGELGLAGSVRNTAAGVVIEVEGDRGRVEEFARRIQSRLVAYIPRDRIVQIAEINKQTVMEFAPASGQAAVYRDLARNVLENTDLTIPRPLEMDELESLALEFV